MNFANVLPVSNPVCVHQWTRCPNRYAWQCVNCEYELTELELVRPHEGDQTDDGAPEP